MSLKVPRECNAFNSSLGKEAVASFVLPETVYPRNLKLLKHSHERRERSCGAGDSGLRLFDVIPSDMISSAIHSPLT
jgi:hypothetical protein